MLLYGNDLAGYIKQRHFEQIRSMQYLHRAPALAVITFQNEEVVSSKYTNIKKQYGHDIGVKVDVHKISTPELLDVIQTLNQDTTVDGIVTQLPVPEDVDTNEAVNAISSHKDVDALGEKSGFVSPASNAILWLLSGYNIDISCKTVGIIGQGRLVGRPLAHMLRQSGQELLVCDEYTGDLREILGKADTIVTATGHPGLIKNTDIRSGTTFIDAGTASAQGALVGDVERDAYTRNDINISPVPGGVGPLTVCALFENVLYAFEKQLRPTSGHSSS